MRILVSNDDGIKAPGIFALARAMTKLGDVVVVAPSEQKSASSHGISLNRTMYVEKADFGESGILAYSLTGTPVDCVKWAAAQLQTTGSFDFMVSGINEGQNLATDVLYSGTLAAAGEACLQGIPAIAFSLSGPDAYPYDEAALVAVAMTQKVLARLDAMPNDTFLNVNMPSPNPSAAPWVVTELGVRSYRDEFYQAKDDEGNLCYRYGGEIVDEIAGETADITALRNQKVSITPIRYRFTNHQMLDSLTMWFAK